MTADGSEDKEIRPQGIQDYSFSDADVGEDFLDRSDDEEADEEVASNQALPALYTVESGKNVTFFEQLFCFYQLVLVV